MINIQMDGLSNISLCNCLLYTSCNNYVIFLLYVYSLTKIFQVLLILKLLFETYDVKLNIIYNNQ